MSLLRLLEQFLAGYEITRVVAYNQAIRSVLPHVHVCTLEIPRCLWKESEGIKGELHPVLVGWTPRLDV